MKNISKITLLLLIYFLPFLIGGMVLDLSFGPWLSLIFFISFLTITYFLTPIMILASLSAAKREDRRFAELTQEVKQVAFSLRMNSPQLYFTRQGSPSIWSFGLGARSTYLILHRDLLDLLTDEERKSILTFQLLRMRRKKLWLDTFLVSLGLWFYFPLYFLFNKRSGIFSGAFFLSSSVAVFIIEMLQSIVFTERMIYELDQKTVKTLRTSSAFISALTKLDDLDNQLVFNERFLQIISTIKPAAQKDFLSFFVKYPSSSERVDLLRSGQVL